MNAYVERTCTAVGSDKNDSLSNYRETNAYVLLGGPGSGKTRSFQEEARLTEGGLYVSAHDFAELNRQSEWRDKTLFIDGLDELRASSPSPAPLGRIRTKLDELGKPRFRLSCRDADWHGALDKGDLAQVSRDGQITELRLEPLSDSEVDEFLAVLDVNKADLAYEDSTASLLRNPLSLELLVRAVDDGQRPRSRKEAFEASCRSLLRERNPRHARSRENESFGVDEQLDAVGHLCAVALLAGKRGYDGTGAEPGAHWIAIEDMPGNRSLFNSVLRTRLFESADGQFSPLHHHIAEFLAGRHLANRVAADLPTGRATALMTGFDGGVVAALRGVWAWFAAHCTVARAELIDGDPLGTVLYGDVKQFSIDDKQRVLDGVSRSEELLDLPIGSPRRADLATEEVAHLIWNIFSQAPNSERGQRVALFLADAPEHRSFPDLRPLLLSIVRNEGLWSATRQKALHRLISQFRDAPTLDDDLDSLLNEIDVGQLTDHDNELTGRLLYGLYPHRRSLDDAKGFFHAPKEPKPTGWYRFFWMSVVKDKAVESEREEAEQLAAEFQRLANEVLDKGRIV